MSTVQRKFALRDFPSELVHANSVDAQRVWAELACDAAARAFKALNEKLFDGV